MVQRKITYVPGLYKIFDEIVVNAADNKQRDASMTEIKIDIDREKNKLSVYNNGKGIPVAIHKEEKVYVPELIFGHLLTSSNYNDDKKKVTGGRNGYGAKLANIFSSEFTIETADSNEGKKYKQVFKDNMKTVGKPQIKEGCNEDWTKISWVPDLAKFGMTALDDDIVALFARRAYDLAGCTHSSVKVYLNGKRISVNNFSNYVDLFLGPKMGGSPRVFEKVSDRWEVAIAPSDDGFQQFSFVNSIATTKGGTHVTHVADQVVEKVLEFITKKHKGMEKTLKPAHVKAHMKVFVNCLIENPAFDSQTKEYMTLKQSAFGSKCTFGQVLQGRAQLRRARVDPRVRAEQAEQGPEEDRRQEEGAPHGHLQARRRQRGRRQERLQVHAHHHRGRLREGPRRLGPLGDRPRLLRRLPAARQAAQRARRQPLDDHEQQGDLGAQADPRPAAGQGLHRPRRAQDAAVRPPDDHDRPGPRRLAHQGADHQLPPLLLAGAAQADRLPARVRHADRQGHQGARVAALLHAQGVLRLARRQRRGRELVRDQVLQGAGHVDVDGGEAVLLQPAAARAHLQVGLRPRRVAHRARLRQVDGRRSARSGCAATTRAVYIDHSSDTISYSDFIDRELIHFSNADNVRSIPSMVDGLKPGQRKILFACFKRGKSMIKNEIKVAQLSGYVAEHSAYHHGETSLASTIVGMAQTFVGSNNIALLHPAGQFGTRLLGGKDAASPRYIFTKLPALTRLIFHPDDDAPAEYLEDDGQSIEPRHYMPVIPPWCSSTAPRASARAGRRTCPTTTRATSSPT